LDIALTQFFMRAIFCWSAAEVPQTSHEKDSMSATVPAWMRDAGVAPVFYPNQMRGELVYAFAVMSREIQ
jgi:hypothetical protein